MTLRKASRPQQIPVNLSCQIIGLIIFLVFISSGINEFTPKNQAVLNANESILVVPGGHSIGVFMQSEGITVVELTEIEDPSGVKHAPSKEAGLKAKDQVIAIDGCAIVDEGDFAEKVNQAGQVGKAVELTIQRGQNQILASVNPAFCVVTKRYRLGILVKDGSSGVGTLTFYNPQTMVYAALGHVVTERENKEYATPNIGRIVFAGVQGIQPGKKGRPGEKIGILSEGQAVGSIQQNCDHGIYGLLSQKLEHNLYSEAIPLGLKSETITGAATMLTVIEGTEIRAFSIEIEKTSAKQGQNSGMVIRITDPELIRLTGGIIQGMSGSPIIQNGRLVGAVTHVFVNDPTRGYALPAEEMLSEILKIPENSPEVRSYTSDLSL